MYPLYPMGPLQSRSINVSRAAAERHLHSSALRGDDVASQSEKRTAPRHWFRVLLARAA